MRIAVLGASGMAGSAITEEAAARGHDVLAVARRFRESVSASASASASVAWHAIDVTDTAALTDAISPADAVVLAVRPRQGQEHEIARMTKSALDAASSAAAPLVVIGGAGPLWSPNLPDTRVLDDPSFVPPEWRAVASASADQLLECEAHPYRGWTYVSPPAIFSAGPRSGRYVRGGTTLLVDANGESVISAADLAIAVLDEIERPGTDRHFTVASNSS